MKESLKKLINSTIVLEYKLPDVLNKIEKSFITSLDRGDDCYKVNNMDDFCRIIYETILYYSYDEFQLEGGDHQKMFLKAFNSKFKYNYKSSDLAKLKLGIYGESLLYCILSHFYKTNVLVSRGYFYDVQKKTEVTGYDAFHLVQDGDDLQLWFGETKFYEDGKAAINSVFKSIEKAISDDYLINTNFFTILQRKGNIVNKTSKIYKILDRWDKSIIESLEKELKDNDIKLIYPVLITYDDEVNDYNESIKIAINHIKDKYSHIVFNKISISFSIFFILIPIQHVRTTKQKIIKWIDTQEPLML